MKGRGLVVQEPTKPQTSCDGLVLLVSEPLSVDHMEIDGRSQPSLTPCILCQQNWKMLGHVRLKSSPAL